MNGWKDFETDDKMSVMNTRVGDQLAWQVKQQVEQRIRDYRRVTVDEIAAAFNMALRAILSIMTSGIGKCVADGSQGSCPMITSMQGR